MAYEIYDLKGILFLVFAIPMIASTNIDCSGKAFHCVNSTHFMICVDLGGGVSTTIDDFVIPCPPTTVCHKKNIFECEFPKIQVPATPLQVIGVSKESDLSVTNSVIHSATIPTPPDKSLIMLNENTTVITVPIPEEETSVNKFDVLESFKQTSENTTVTNEIVNLKQTNNNINRITSAIDKNTKLDSAVQTSTNKAVITSDKSIDTMATSIKKHNELISDDFLKLANTSIISYNSTSSVDLLITKRLMKHADVNKTVADEINTTPDGMNKIEDNNNKNAIIGNPISEISTTEKVLPENNYIVPLVEVVIDQTAADRNDAPLGSADLFLGDNVASTIATPSDTFINISHDTVATAEQYTTTQTTLNGEKIKNVTGLNADILRSTTTAANMTFENNVKNHELVHRNFVEQIPIDEVTGSEQIPERITKDISLDKIETSVSAPETIVTSPQTTTDATLENIVYYATTIVNNNSFVEDITDAHSSEIIMKTDLTIPKFTDTSYTVNQESSKAFIATNNNASGTNETIATIKSMYDTSSTNMFNDISTELNTFLTATTMYPTTELRTPLNEAIANGIEPRKAVTPATIATSINIKTHLNNNNNTTPGPYNATFNSITNTTVKDWMSQTDIFPTASVDDVLNIITLKTSENYTILDRSPTTENSIITNQVQEGKIFVETVIPQENLNSYKLNKTTQEEIVNKSNTIYLRDISKQNILNNTFNPIITNNNVTSPPTIYASQLTTYIPETIYTTIISIDSISKVPKDNPEITDKSFYANGYQVETSTRLPLDVTHYTNMGGGEESYENILIKTTSARESIAQEVDTHKRMNINIAPTKTLTDVISSTMITIYAKKYDFTSNFKDSVNIETATSGLDQNEIAHKFGTTKSNNITYSDRTTSLSPAPENVRIVSLIESTSSVKNSLSNMAFKPSSLITKPLLNLTKNNVINISLSDGYIDTNKPENSNFYTTLAYYNPSKKNVDVTEPENIHKNTQTIEFLPKKSHMNLESSITVTQTAPIKEESTENGKSSTDSSLHTVGLNQSDSTTNSMNYVTDKITDFAPLRELNSTKRSSLPNVETNATNTVNSLILDTIIKTTAFVPSATNITRPQVVKNIEQRKGLPVFPTVTETQTNNYDIIKSLLPALDPNRKNCTLSRVTSAPIAAIYNDVTKINTSDLPVHSTLPTVNYNVPQSMAETTETVQKYVPAAGSRADTINGIGEKIIETNNPANVSFGVNKTFVNSNLYDKSVHEKILMDNNTFQNNKLNTTIITRKELVDSNKEILYSTENDGTPMKVNTGSAQKITFKINDSSLVGEVTSESTGLKTIRIQNKNLRTNPLLAIHTDHKYTKQADFVVITKPLYAIENGSTALKYLPQSKPIGVYTDKLLQNNKTEVNYTTQDEVQTNSRNTSNTNLHTSYSHLPLQNNIVNVSLKEHLTSTNHTITTEIQGHFNKNVRQTNELKLGGNSSAKSNITTRSITFNLGNKYNSTINDSASLFNCSNHTRGKYADKKDCRKFYTCVGNLQPIIGTCPNNTVFSEVNKQCTRNLSHCVRNNQFRCLLEGRFSDFFLDNIYYICVKNSTNAFVRYKLQCQNGYDLNKGSVKCERNEDMLSQSASSGSDNSRIYNDESQPIIKKEETKPNNSMTNFECNSEGKFPYEKDCRKYYVCTNVKNMYRRKIKKCASDEVYDDGKKKCIESESIEC